MSQAGGSDLFIAADFAPSMKTQGSMKPLTTQKLGAEVTRMLAHSLMNEAQRVTHREVGIDTKSWHHALKNTLRSPDRLIA